METSMVFSFSPKMFISLVTVTLSAVSVQSSALYVTNFIGVPSSSYGAKALCYYAYGSGIADVTSLKTLLSSQPISSVTTMTSFFAAPSHQVKSHPLCSIS